MKRPPDRKLVLAAMILLIMAAGAGFAKPATGGGAVNVVFLKMLSQ